MSEETKFVCDVTGEQYGALNAGDGLIDFEIRRHIGGSPFEVSTREVHISIDEVTKEVGYWVPEHIKYVGVKDREIVGASVGFRPGMRGEMTYPYKERGDVTMDKYEDFFKFVEEHVMY